MSEKKTLTTPRVAEMCGVTTMTVTRWIKEGYFPGVQKGLGKTSPYRIPQDEVEAFTQRATLAALTEMLQQSEERRPKGAFALIVEDDADAGGIFEFTLQAAGFATRVVKSAGEAFTWLASIVPDVIVLDLHLPDMPGTEVLRRMRANPQLADVPVIVATAHPEMAEEIEDEVELVLIKPVRYNVLQDKAVELTGAQ
jgi:excisionase family DNA binding protein